MSSQALAPIAPGSFTPLPLPTVFNPGTVGEVWRVPYQDLARAAINWAQTQGISPASQDTLRTCLLLIDVQNTFCIPEFELYVGGASGLGAVTDNTRLCEFIYRNLGSLTQIVATLDTHHAQQIFHPIFWVNAAGEHPQPATMISAREVAEGIWRVNPRLENSAGADDRFLQTYAEYYVTQLEQSGKYPLTVWPYHAMLGGVGHALVAAVEAACFFHGMARQTQTQIELKGDHPLTENYSALSPEVKTDASGQPLAADNKALLQSLLTYDRVIIAGQAKSHCVAWTVADLLTEIQTHRPEFVEQVYLLTDCTSPVVIPGVVDFTATADAAFAQFAEAGMHLVETSTPLTAWTKFLG